MTTPNRIARLPVARAAAAQATAAVMVQGGLYLLVPALPAGVHAAAPLAVQGLVAATLGAWPMRLAPWWLVINAVFPAAVVFAAGTAIPGWAYLAAFVLASGVYWNASHERVPLYLTNPRTAQALAALLPAGTGPRIVDLGCGPGGTARRLARLRPDAQVLGIETAPVLFAIAALRQRLAPLPNLVVRHGDLWDLDLRPFDVAYGFLSPEPMPRLYAKAMREMAPGALFVSNSFAVPGHPPDRIEEVDDRRATRLLAWRIRPDQTFS